MNLADTIKKILREHRFKIHLGSIPRGFTWEPDILAGIGNRLVAFLVRESNTVREVFVQRMSTTRISKNSLAINIVFLKKPKQNVVRMVGLYGIGVCYVSSGRLKTLASSKSFSSVVPIPKEKVKKKFKMARTDIFISSHQIIREREIAQEMIRRLNRAYMLAIFPILV